MLIVRYTVGNITSLTIVGDIHYWSTANTIEFTPLADVEKFFIYDCSLSDFDTICNAFRSNYFVDLDAFGYKVDFV